MDDWPTEPGSEVPTPSLIAAWLVLDTLPAERVPLWAAHWLAAGYDGESLRALAGLSGKNPHDVRDLLPDALRECGVDSRVISSSTGAHEAAAMEAFTAIARLQANDRVSERWVVSRVYDIVEPDFDIEIIRLPLGRLFGLDDEWDGGWGRTDDQLRAEVRKACQDQIAAAYHGFSVDEPAASVAEGRPTRVADQQAHSPHPATRVWRVRTWIRAAAILVGAFICAEQWDIVRRVGLGEMPRTEARDGYIFLGGYALGMFLLAFRPVLRLAEDGTVYLRNPLRSRRFHTGEVMDVSVDRWGLVISLSAGHRLRSIIFQDTAHFGEPRWFDVAEALTGRRPTLS